MLNLNWLNKKWISQLVKPPGRRKPDYLRNPFYIASLNKYIETVYGTEYPHNPLPIARRLRTVLELVPYYGDCCIGSSPGSDSLRLQTFPGRIPVAYHGVLLITVAGPHRPFTGLPY